MNPMSVKFAVSTLRQLMKAGGLLGTTSDDQLTQLVSGLVALGGFAWGYWKDYTSQQVLVTALASHIPMSEVEARSLVTNPSVITPSVTSPKDEIPQ